MLGSYDDHRRVFIEVTKNDHGHGGHGWEFGTCLWSPSKNKRGHDLYRLMREVEDKDLVLHLLHESWGSGEVGHRFAGSSFASGPVEIRELEPPIPGAWVDQAPYYKIPLHSYSAFPSPVSLNSFIPLFERELRNELITHPVYFPFTLYNDGREVRLRQGSYINACTPGLFNLVRQALGEIDLSPNQKRPNRAHALNVDREFKETKRLASERYAFARNPALVREAKEIRGLRCEACGFDFEETYGELGSEYIECHHVDPLGARRSPSTTTTIQGVRMLCANCHRMVHRKQPPMLAEDLRDLLGLAPLPPLPVLIP